MLGKNGGKGKAKKSCFSRIGMIVAVKIERKNLSACPSFDKIIERRKIKARLLGFKIEYNKFCSYETAQTSS